MRTTMKKSIAMPSWFFLIVCGLLCACWPSQRLGAQTLGTDSLGRQLATPALAGLPLVAVGDLIPSESEANAVRGALGVEQNRTLREAAPDLEFFVQNHPNSP